MAKFLGLDSVLVLSPHPDDAEYSISGTVMKYTHTQFHILTCSIGGNFDETTGIDRNEESKKFWESIPNANVVDNEEFNFVINDVGEDRLVHLVDMCRTKVYWQGVLCPPQLDSHFEHRLINNVGRAVCRFGSRALIEYNTPSTMNTWVPMLFIDIHQQLNRKKELLNCFQSQINRKYFHSNVVEDFHSDFFCSKRGFGRVEKFKVDFLIG